MENIRTMKEKLFTSGDELTPELQKHFQNDMITGFDFDPTMLGISAMNLMVMELIILISLVKILYLLTLLKIIQVKL